MKKITLEEAYHELLDQCMAVVWGGDGCISYPGLNDLDGDEDNCFLELNCGGDGPSLQFFEGNNEMVVIDGCRMLLMDGDNEIQELVLLDVKDLEAPFINRLEDLEE